MTFHPTVQALFDWLVDGTPGAPTPMAVLERFCPDLVAAGVPLERTSAFVRTLHPSVMGRRFLWERGVAKVTAHEATWEMLSSRIFLGSPLAKVFSDATTVRYRLTPEASELPKDMVDLRTNGFTDWLGCPLKFIGGTTHGITFAGDGKYLLVTNTGTSTVSVIETEKDQVVGTIKVAGGPEGIAYKRP